MNEFNAVFCWLLSWFFIQEIYCQLLQPSSSNLVVVKRLLCNRCVNSQQLHSNASTFLGADRSDNRTCHFESLSCLRFESSCVFGLVSLEFPPIFQSLRLNFFLSGCYVESLLNDMKNNGSGDRTMKRSSFGKCFQGTERVTWSRNNVPVLMRANYCICTGDYCNDVGFHRFVVGYPFGDNSMNFVQFTTVPTAFTFNSTFSLTTTTLSYEVIDEGGEGVDYSGDSSSTVFERFVVKDEDFDVRLSTTSTPTNGAVKLFRNFFVTKKYFATILILLVYYSCIFVFL